ncbi:MAG: PAS domain S-box protein, partial [Smithellaceae bacterium]|nr:PAS domain S-box protein [Smithellaceae bacterium]
MKMTDPSVYNSANVKTYIEYLRAKHPEVDTSAILHNAGITNQEVEDSGHWFGQEEINRFYDEVAKRVDGLTSAREAGRYSATSQAGSILKQYATGFLSPGIAYWMLEKLAATVSRHMVLKVNRISANKVEITVTPRPGVEERPFQCENRIGLFEAVAQIFTKKYARVDHPQCLHQGSDCCRYLVSWEKQPHQAWERIGRYVALWGGVSSLPMVFVFSLPFLLGYMFSFSLLTLGSLLYAKTIRCRDLATHLENQGSAADLLIDQMNIRHNESLLIRELGQASISILDLEQLLKYFMTALEKRLDFDRGMILLGNSEKTRLHYSVGFGYKPEQEEFLRSTVFHLDNPESKGPVVLAFKEQKPFLISDIKTLEDQLSEKSWDFAQRLGVHSFISVPIVYKNVPEGVLAVDNTSARRHYNESDISLLMGIAHQIAISMHNAASHMRIQESEERFRSLSENAPDIIYNLDNEGVLTYLNPAWERIMGYSREETIGRYFTAFIKAGEEDVYRTIQNKIHADRETVQNFDGLLIDKKGVDRAFLMNVAPRLDEKGNVVGTMGILRDVTEQRRLEAQLYHTSKMEAIGRLTGGISHDFNNLLQAIGGYHQLLLMQKTEDDPDWKYLISIGKLTQKAGDLVRQLMLFSRKAETFMRPLNLNDEISKFHELLVGIIPKMITMDLRLATELDRISGDPGQIHQIIMNLAINARDAMPAGGKITVATENLSLAETIYRDSFRIDAGQYVHLAFQDNGPGMTKESLANIFEPFFTTKEIGKGTGLGLSVVYGIVKNHNGYIFCESTPGAGTNFHIYFPALGIGAGEIALEEPSAPVEAGGGAETILLVDDEKSILEITEEILTMNGYRVITAESGEEALEIYQREKGAIHLVVLDLIMPGMGGHECLLALVKINPLARVMITSGYTAQITTQAAIKSGARRFV